MGRGDHLEASLSDGSLQVFDKEADTGGVETFFDLLEKEDVSRLGCPQSEERAEKAKSSIGGASRRDPCPSLLDEDRHDVSELLDLRKIQVIDVWSAQLAKPIDQRLFDSLVAAQIGEHAREVLSVVA